LRVLVSLVALVVDIATVDDAALTELRQRIDGYLKLDDALDLDPSRSALLDVAAGIFGREAADERFRTLLSDVANASRSRWPQDTADLHGDADTDRLALDLANAIHVFSWARHSGTSERVLLFCELLRHVAKVSQDFRSVALQLLESVMVQADIPTAALGIWPGIFELKARR
jgi:hypothetical protein